jgi:hypothetical protein
MAIARVVAFEDVDEAHMTGLQGRLEAGERPDGMPPVEIMALYDATAGRALVVQVFDNADDYARGEAIFAAMAPGDTPGRRTSVTRYDVAARLQG